MKKLEREELLADQATTEAAIKSAHASDILGQTSLRSRLEEIKVALAKLEGRIETRGSVALMFGGMPVHGSRSIDAEFATGMLEEFQAMVNKSLAADDFGHLGSRGPVKTRVGGNLSITEIIRGSVGFLLEECDGNEELDDSPVKGAIAKVADIISKTASEDENDFERAIESLDSRLLVSLKNFFKIMDEKKATIRIVDDSHEAKLDMTAVKRGRKRIDTTEIQEKETEDIVGELLGILPDSRKFEMRLAGTNEVIKGSVIARYAAQYLQQIEGENLPLAGRKWRAKMKVREITERNKPPRSLYTLVGLLNTVDDPSDKIEK